MKTRRPARLIGAFLLVAAAAVAGAQQPGVPMNQGQRGMEAGPRAPDAATRGQERGSAARGPLGAPFIMDEASSAGRSLGRGRARALAETHFHRLEQLVRANPRALELVDRAVAVRGEIVAVDPPAGAIEAAREHGYSLIGDEVIEGLGTRYVTLGTPAGTSLKRALADLRRIAPKAVLAANHVHMRSGSMTALQPEPAEVAASSVINGRAIGIIDGGVGQTAVLPILAQRGFARGAPAPDAHATAVASLAAGIGPVRSGSPGAPLLVADIYGNDPGGGNSLALARALGWMAQRKIPVVLISLVGPSNPLVASAVKQVQARGMYVVAPVGNAGPAAPPMFPASYPGVIAVTGVDSRNRALIEAGRGLHLDYAAPGADIFAASLNGRLVKVRGTSFAAPLVAGRLWLARRSRNPISVLDREALDLGRKGADKTFGRGLVCGECR